MTERERLVELIGKGATNYVCSTNHDSNAFEYIADHLLANGVIVPSVSFGNYIWFIVNGEVGFGIVEEITFRRAGDSFAYVFAINEHNEIENEWSIPLCDFGKTVFLTKEAAEQALKERERE